MRRRPKFRKDSNSRVFQFEPTSKDYFLFTVQQVAFIRLCGGDPRTMQGGDPELGQRIVNNGQHIIDHYWRSGKD